MKYGKIVQGAEVEYWKVLERVKITRIKASPLKSNY